jgi:hypothetical protein
MMRVILALQNILDYETERVDTRGENSHAGFESAGAARLRMESEPTTWRGVIAHWKEGRGQV